LEVCICNRQLTEVTGLSRIGNSLVDDRKNADGETSMSEYSFSSFYVGTLTLFYSLRLSPLASCNLVLLPYLYLLYFLHCLCFKVTYWFVILAYITLRLFVVAYIALT